MIKVRLIYIIRLFMQFCTHVDLIILADLSQLLVLSFSYTHTCAAIREEFKKSRTLAMTEAAHLDSVRNTKQLH